MATNNERRVNKIIDRVVVATARAMRSFFNEEKEILMDAVRSRSLTNAAEATFDQRVVLLNDHIGRYLTFAYRKGYEMVTGVEKDKEFLKRIETIVLNTNRALRQSESVEQFFDQTSKWRSKSIAITEINSAFNNGIQDGAIEVERMIEQKQESFAKTEGPIQALARLATEPKKKRLVYKEWRAQADNRVRDDHADAHGQQKRVHLAFDVGGEKLMYPGDPSGSPENIINCRCYERIIVRVV